MKLIVRSFKFSTLTHNTDKHMNSKNSNPGNRNTQFCVFHLPNLISGYIQHKPGIIIPN